nr:uncharacterized protein LOC109743113 [Aegilops tauschii subsp. strangulata]
MAAGVGGQDRGRRKRNGGEQERSLEKKRKRTLALSPSPSLWIHRRRTPLLLLDPPPPPPTPLPPSGSRRAAAPTPSLWSSTRRRPDLLLIGLLIVLLDLLLPPALLSNFLRVGVHHASAHSLLDQVWGFHFRTQQQLLLLLPHCFRLRSIPPEHHHPPPPPRGSERSADGGGEEPPEAEVDTAAAAARVAAPPPQGRNIERQIQDVQKEEKKVEKAIRDAAKALAKELVQSRKAVNHLYENNAQLNSISMHLGCCDRRPEQQDPHEDPAEVDVGQEDHQALVHVARSCSSPRLALMKNTSAFVANNTRMLHN